MSAIRKPAAHLFDGYSHSGDIGHLHAEGSRVITGRKKTALTFGGDTINPGNGWKRSTAHGSVAEAVCSLPYNAGIAQLSALIVTSGAVDEVSLRTHCAAGRPPAAFACFIVVDAPPPGWAGEDLLATAA